MEAVPAAGVAAVLAGEQTTPVVAPPRKTAQRSAPKWETDARERVRTAVRRYARPLADLIARDANEGDTRLLVTDFLCEGLGYDKYEDLTTEYQVKGDSPITAFGSPSSWSRSSKSSAAPPSSLSGTCDRSRCTPSTRASSG